MALDWRQVAGGLGSLAVGAIPALGPVGGLLGAGLQLGLGAFGASDSANASSQTQSDIGVLKQLQGESAYTATGKFGAAAQQEAQEKANQYLGKQSAEGRLAQSALKNIASSQLSAPQAAMDAATAAASRDLGNQRRSFMESMNASGAPLAARIAAASNLGQASAQNLGNIFTQGAQATQQALAGAAGTFGEAERQRMSDLATQKSIFEASAMQLNPAMSAGQLGSLAQTRTENMQQSMSEDPLAPVKKLGWQYATQQLNQPWQNQAAQEQQNALQGKGPMTGGQRWQNTGSSWNIFG